MRVMTFCLSLIAAGCLQLSAQRVTFQEGTVSLKQAFEKIESASKYKIAYNDTQLDVTKQVVLNQKNKDVLQVLSDVLKGSGYTFKSKGNYLIITSENQRDSQSSQGHKSKRVSGTIVDEKGEPLSGVNVVEKGTTNGTITGVDGSFNLNVDDASMLSVSFIGYNTQEFSVKKSSVFSIKMSEDSKLLDEVVVVGFGTQKKVNLSGSVSSVNVSDMAKSRPITNLSSALAGASSGLNVTSNNNRPGSDDASLLIRGVGTLNNSSPLIIIDGVEGVLSDININDVENISILKDASSSAIYGSRAANGVILVTTKAGQSGKMKLSYNGYVSFQSARNNVLEPVSNYADYMGLMNDAYTNSGVAAPYSTSSIKAWRDDNGANPLQYPNVNWLDDSFRTGVGSNHTLSMQGGADNIQFYSSIGYYDNPGVLENTGYQRYHVMSNITANVTPWLKMGLSMNGYYGKADPASGDFGWGFATTPAMILRHNGLYGGIQDSQDDVSSSSNNMLASLNSSRGDNITRNGKGRLFVTVNPIKDLSVTGSMVYEYTSNNTKTIPIFNDFWNFATNSIILKGGGQTYISQSTWRRQRNYMDVVSHYNHRFLENNLGLNVMAGASQEQYTYENEGVTRKDLLDLSLSVLDAANGSLSASGAKTVWTMRSYFGRINLDWKNKYLLEFNLRTDGSSRFMNDNRWGWFPSGSVAWRISEEGFMKDIDWMNNLKIRASYGSLGNNSVGNYAARSTYGNSTYVIANAVQTGWAITALANPSLTWEKTKVADVGLDFNLLNNRLSTTIDWFDKRTSGILIQLPVPAVHGTASAPTTNAAKVSNKGIELTIGWNDKVGNFKYGITANYTHISNKIDKFKGKDYSLSGYNYIKEGGSIGDMFMYKKDRIISTSADLDIVNQMLAKNPKAFQSLGAVPGMGDILFKDVNGDGVINTDDRTVVGNTNPNDLLGLTLTAGWKGIDLSVRLDGSFGFQGYINEYYYNTNVSKGHQLSKYVTDNVWKEGKTSAMYPKLTYSSAINTITNTTWMQNRDYLKIRNIELGYTLPKSLTRKIYTERVRLYGTLENFFTFTSWKGIDPETDNLVYPTMRQAVIGVNVEF